MKIVDSTTAIRCQKIFHFCINKNLQTNLQFYGIIYVDISKNNKKDSKYCNVKGHYHVYRRGTYTSGRYIS